MNNSARRYLSRSCYVEDLVDEWKLSLDQAMFALDVEELVKECIDLGNLSKHAWNGFRELLLKDPNAQVIEDSGLVMKEAVTKTLEIFRTVQSLVREMSHKGHVIQDNAGFEAIFHETKKISNKVNSVFLEVDPRDIEESIAAFKRGEYRTSEELLRAAQDGCFPPN